MSWMVGAKLPVGSEIFLFATMSRLTLEAPRLLSNTGVSSMGIKQPEHDADHSLQCPMSRMCEAVHPLYIFMAWSLYTVETLPFMIYKYQHE
jgi:hypothetical protein